MGFKPNENRANYQEPIRIAGAQVGPRLIGASETLPWFSTEEPRELISVLSVFEYLTTNLAGTNNDLTFFARLSGDQNITITFVDPGGATSSLSVEVVDTDITVTLARAASAIISKASEVKAAIEASPEASALVSVILAAGNDGTGVVTAMTSTPLAGPAGTLPTLDVEFEASIDGVEPYSIGATFTQNTAVGIEAGYFDRLGISGRYKLTLGGTNPEFAIGIVTVFKP